LIVFAVKICKRCLQAASAPGGILSLDPNGRLSSPDPLGYTQKMKIPGAALDSAPFPAEELIALPSPSSW